MSISKIIKTGLSFGLVLFLTTKVAYGQACSFTPSFTADTSICLGSTAWYKATPTSGNTYSWSVENGKILSGGNSDSVVVLWHTIGLGSIKLVESSGSCTDSVIQLVTVGPSVKKMPIVSYKLLGNASQSGGIVTLTTQANSQTGGAWYPDVISLDKSFDLHFQVYLCGSADGMIFILQNSGTSALGATGGSLGYYQASSGVFDQSLGVELDIYSNGSGSYDSSASHLALVKNKSFTTLRPQVQISNPTIGGQCAYVPFRFRWNAVLKEVDVWYDSVHIFNYPVDLKKDIFKGGDKIYFGFTGATGGLNADQKFKTDSLLISNNPESQIADINKPDHVCSGDTLKYEIIPPRGLKNSDYGTKWKISSFSFKTLAGTGSSNASIVYPSSSGNGKIVFHPVKTEADSIFLMNILTEANVFSGCDSVFSKYIKVHTPPVAGFNLSSTKICRGGSISFTNSSTGATKYKWYLGDGVTKTDTSFSYNYPYEGTYTVSLVASNPGCRDSITKTITIEAPPTGVALKQGAVFDGYFFSGTANDPDLVCVRDTLMYEIVPPPAFTNGDYGSKWELVSYSIKSTGGNSATKDSLVKPSSSGAGAIIFLPTFNEADRVYVITTTFRALNSSCKDTTMARYVSVSTSPTANFNYKGQCVGEPTVFTDASTVAQGLVVRKYEFGVGNAFATTANPTYTYNAAGEYTITYTVTGKGGCSDVIHKKITIYDKPTVDFDIPATVCAGNPATFINKANGNGRNIVRYKWTFNEGTAKDTANLANAAHTYKTTGSHTATLQVWTDGGCNASVTKTITVVDAPTASFPDPKGCLNQDITFTNNSSGAASYEWRFSDNKTYYTKEVTRKFEFPSTYEVTMVAISTSGCRDSMTKTMSFYPQPTMDFSWSGSCADQEVEFTDATTVSGGGSIVDWNWTIDGTVKKSGNKMSHSFSAGAHQVKLKVKTNNGCTDSIVKNINIDPKPVADIIVPGSACVNVAVNIQNNSTGTGNTYKWTFGDGGSSNDAQPSYTYTNQGTYQVKMIVTNNKGCKDSATKTIKVGLGPSVPFDWCADGRKVHFYLTNKTYSTYEWEFGDALGGTATGIDPVYTYLSANGEYDVTVTVTDAVGCEGTYTATVGTGFLDNSTITSCTIGINEAAAKQLGLNIYPNPFSHKTLIEYELLKSQQVRVSVWDAAGKEVAVLRNGMEAAGMQQVSLDANEHKLQPGLYMIRIETAGTVAASQVLKLE